MKNLSLWLKASHIALDLPVQDFGGWVNHLVEELTAQGDLAAEQGKELAQAVLSREALAPTAVGRGVVIPHAYLEVISEPMVFFARASAPLDHNAPDGEPVDLMFLLTGPPNAQSTHLKALARIVRLVHHKELLESLRRAETAQAVLEAIGAAERHHG